MLFFYWPQPSANDVHEIFPILTNLTNFAYLPANTLFILFLLKLYKGGGKYTQKRFNILTLVNSYIRLVDN